MTVKARVPLGSRRLQSLLPARATSYHSALTPVASDRQVPDNLPGLHTSQHMHSALALFSSSCEVLANVPTFSTSDGEIPATDRTTSSSRRFPPLALDPFHSLRSAPLEGAIQRCRGDMSRLKGWLLLYLPTTSRHPLQVPNACSHTMKEETLGVITKPPNSVAARLSVSETSHTHTDGTHSC